MAGAGAGAGVGVEGRPPSRRCGGNGKVGEKKRTRPPPEAVRFRRPPPAVPRVAIIGGGVAGLTCASRLEARGACVVLAMSRKIMTRLLSAESKNVYVQCNVLYV